LKLRARSHRYCTDAVAPHAGAWIETEEGRTEILTVRGRPPRGGVD